MTERQPGVYSNGTSTYVVGSKRGRALESFLKGYPPALGINTGNLVREFKLVIPIAMLQ